MIHRVQLQCARPLAALVLQRDGAVQRHHVVQIGIHGHILATHEAARAGNPNGPGRRSVNQCKYPVHIDAVEPRLLIDEQQLRARHT